MSNTPIAVYADGSLRPVGPDDTPVGPGGVPIGTGGGGGDSLASSTVVKAVYYTSSAPSPGTMPNQIDNLAFLSNGDKVAVFGDEYGSHPWAGIYVVTDSGSGSNGTWNRHPDFDTAAKMNALNIVSATAGSKYMGKVIFKVSPPIATLGGFGETINFKVANDAYWTSIDFTFSLPSGNVTDALAIPICLGNWGYATSMMVGAKTALTSGQTATFKLMKDGNVHNELFTAILNPTGDDWQAQTNTKGDESTIIGVDSLRLAYNAVINVKLTTTGTPAPNEFRATVRCVVFSYGN